MTEDEKELENKIKQYQYEIEENKKRLETLHNDMDKKNKKKSFTYKFNKTIGRTILVWSSIGIVSLLILLILALKFLIDAFNSFDPVKEIEQRYDIDLKTISREAENKILTYKVQPTDWKYRNVEFTIIKVGRGDSYNDYGANCLKYIIENMKKRPKSAELVNDFEVQETYNEYNLLEYKLIYKGPKENAAQRVQDLQNYILNFDKNLFNIIKENETIKVEG